MVDYDKKSPIDGGWGWMVILGSFLINLIIGGVVFSFGIFCVEFLDEFDVTRSEVGWIGSTLIGVTWASGPLASALTLRYGYRY